MVCTRHGDVVLNAVASQQEGPLCMELHVTCGFSSGVSGVLKTCIMESLPSQHLWPKAPMKICIWSLDAARRMPTAPQKRMSLSAEN